MSIVWEKPEFLPTTDGICTTIDGVSVTAIEKDEGWVLAWSVNAKANLPQAERIVMIVSSAIRTVLDAEGYDWEPESVDGPDD